MKNKRLLYVTLAIIVLALGSWAVFGSGGVDVEAFKVTTADVSRTVEDSAIVQSVNENRLYSNQVAKVASLDMEIGQDVSPGAVIMILQNQDLNIQATQTQIQLAQAQASLDSLAATLERVQLQLSDAGNNQERVAALLASGAVSQSDYEQAVTAVKSLEASEREIQASRQSAMSQITGLQLNLQQIQSKQNEMKIISPVRGTILTLDVKKDQPVNPGQLLATIGTAQSLELKANILSDDLAEMKVGQPVLVTAPVLGTRILEGEIQKIYPQAEEKISALGVIQRRVPVIISLKESANLQPGYEVHIAVQTRQQKDALVVPRQSVRTNTQGTKEVMLIVNNRIKIQPVEIGLGDSKYYTITRGLGKDDVIVKDASQNLAPDSRVKTPKS